MRTVRCDVILHVVIPTGAVRRLHRDSWRGGRVLETHAGEEVDFLWFDKSLWDLLYDFSAVCEDAMRARARQFRSNEYASSPGALVRRFTWTLVGDLLALSAVACPIAGLIAQVRAAAERAQPRSPGPRSGAVPGGGGGCTTTAPRASGDGPPSNVLIRVPPSTYIAATACRIRATPRPAPPS